MDFADKLFNDDCLNILSEMSAESVDCVVTDCPYRISAGGVTIEVGGKEMGGVLNDVNIVFNSACGRKWAKKDGTVPSAVKNGKMFANNDIAFSDWLPLVYKVLKKGTHCYVMINSRNLKELQTEAEKAGFVFQNLLVWNKKNATPNKYYMQGCEFILMLSKRPARNINDMGTPNLITIPNILGKGVKHHPTAKPVELMELLIRNSTAKGEVVLDPFVGGGSTLVAAKRLGRHYVGCEIDTHFYEMALGNLQKMDKEQKQLDLFNTQDL